MKITTENMNHSRLSLKGYIKPLCSLLFMVYCLLFTAVMSAQIYPVQVNPQLIPPYSLKLSDYQTTSSEKLFVNILLTDTQDSGRQVRLKMYIEGQGLNIQTLDFVAGATPIFLDGGVNLRLSNLDLRPYFNLNNLLGITPQQYNQTLRDGRYEFCFEVYDQFSGKRLSQKRCASVFLILNDPPILNVPNRGDLVTVMNPQNILFNWTPRHLNATGVQYEFTLKELWDTGQDPQAAFLSSPPLYQETTFAPTLLYGPANIQLIDGKTYGWQVRAFVSDGISETSVFRNNGYSEIYHFRYVSHCDPPQFILSEAQNSQVVDIAWQASDHIKYNLEYRKKGFSDTEWFSQLAYNNTLTIRNLEPGVTYEFRVGGECTFNGGFAYSGIHEFVMPTEAETAYYNCGVPPSIEITNQTPLPSLRQQDTFTAGDFPVVVVETSGSNGNFSGWGYTTLPFLENLKDVIDAINVITKDENGEGGINIGKYTRIKVEFKGVGINTDYQLISGVVKTSYDPDWGGVVDVDEVIDVIVQTFEEILNVLINIGIDSETSENINNLTDMLSEQAAEEFPGNLATNAQEAASQLSEAKKKYDEALENNDDTAANEAENEFKEAQNALKDAQKEQEKFIKAYAEIIKLALIDIVKESNKNLKEGLDAYGESTFTEQEINQYELTTTGLNTLDDIIGETATKDSDDVLKARFDYEVWSTLNFIAQNLQTEEGTEQLGKLLQKEGQKLGIYVYQRLEEEEKRKIIVDEVKQLIVEGVTKSIGLSVKIF